MIGLALRQITTTEQQLVRGDLGQAATTPMPTRQALMLTTQLARRIERPGGTFDRPVIVITYW